jgi:hypothetical protein
LGRVICVTMKTFHGRRDHDRCRILVSEPAAGAGAGQTWPAVHELPACPELFKGQTLPFEWGSDGPGTAHAAAALLLKVLSGNPSPATVKAVFPLLRRFLAALPEDDFEFSEPFLLAFLQAASEMRPAAAAAGAR